MISGSTFESITYDDLAAMQKALFEINKAEAMSGAFYMSMTAYNALRTSKASGDGNYFNLPPAPTAETPATAWGRPIYVMNEFPTTSAGSTKFAIFTDLSRHGFIGDRRGIAVRTADQGEVDGVNLFVQDAQAIKATKRTAWTTALQSGIVTLSTNA